EQIGSHRRDCVAGECRSLRSPALSWELMARGAAENAEDVTAAERALDEITGEIVVPPTLSLPLEGGGEPRRRRGLLLPPPSRGRAGVGGETATNLRHDQK